jgi:glycosyltransferase involved in cell wall biosynthesis/nitroreductase
MSQKLVSVITPCYNGEKYIHKLLDSVLSQTYSNIEMLIVDDGSEDASEEVIKSYISKFTKKGYSLEYIHQKNQGQSVAINTALKLIKGEYLVWPDADDYYAKPQSIAEMVKTLEKSDDTVSMVRVQYNVFNENGDRIGHFGVTDENRYNVNLFESCLFEFGVGFWGAAGGYMAKVSHVDKLIPGRDIYTEKITGQNWQLCLPLFYKYKCLTIEEDLYNITAHDDSHSRNLTTSIDRENAYYRTIENTLKTIDMPVDYRKSILRRVRSIMDVEKNRKTEQKALRRRRLIKRAIKGAVPHGLIVILRNKGVLEAPTPEVIIQAPPEKSLLEKFSDYDNQIFEKGFAHGDFSQANIEGWMLFCAHVLEKAMSRVNFEEGHNFFRLEQIAKLLREYDIKNFDKKSFAYVYALSSVKEYIQLHKKHNFSLGKIKDVLGDIYDQSLRVNKELAGYKVITKKDKQHNQSINFAELQNNRFSVREFANARVDIKVIRQTIELAMKAPSVCNRQPARVHNIMDPEKIKQVLAIQGGFHGYEMPSCLLLVTTDVRNYVGENERNQGFIDGGSFAMSLLLSLEYYGLAACPLHAMFTLETDQEMRKILDIQNPEYLIMFIAVGHFSDENKVATSSRYPAAEITKEYV